MGRRLKLTYSSELLLCQFYGYDSASERIHQVLLLWDVSQQNLK